VEKVNANKIELFVNELIYISRPVAVFDRKRAKNILDLFNL